MNKHGRLFHAFPVYFVGSMPSKAKRTKKKGGTGGRNDAGAIRLNSPGNEPKQGDNSSQGRSGPGWEDLLGENVIRRAYAIPRAMEDILKEHQATKDKKKKKELAAQFVKWTKRYLKSPGENDEKEDEMGKAMMTVRVTTQRCTTPTHEMLQGCNQVTTNADPHGPDRAHLGLIRPVTDKTSASVRNGFAEYGNEFDPTKAVWVVPFIEGTDTASAKLRDLYVSDPIAFWLKVFDIDSEIPLLIVDGANRIYVATSLDIKYSYASFLSPEISFGEMQALAHARNRQTTDSFAQQSPADDMFAGATMLEQGKTQRQVVYQMNSNKFLGKSPAEVKKMITSKLSHYSMQMQCYEVIKCNWSAFYAENTRDDIAPLLATRNFSHMFFKSLGSEYMSMLLDDVRFIGDELEAKLKEQEEEQEYPKPIPALVPLSGKAKGKFKFRTRPGNFMFAAIYYVREKVGAMLTHSKTGVFNKKILKAAGRPEADNVVNDDLREFISNVRVGTHDEELAAATGLNEPPEVMALNDAPPWVQGRVAEVSIERGFKVTQWWMTHVQPLLALHVKIEESAGEDELQEQADNGENIHERLLSMVSAELYEVDSTLPKAWDWVKRVHGKCPRRTGRHTTRSKTDETREPHGRSRQVMSAQE
jgi:hypothetical protein